MGLWSNSVPSVQAMGVHSLMKHQEQVHLLSIQHSKGVKV